MLLANVVLSGPACKQYHAMALHEGASMSICRTHYRMALEPMIVKLSVKLHVTIMGILQGKYPMSQATEMFGNLSVDPKTRLL